VIPIAEPTKLFRLQVDAHLCEHVANAFDDGRTVQFDFTRYATMRALERYVGKLHEGVVGGPLGSSISRCVVDLDTRIARFEDRLVEPCELPRVSPRVDAARHRFMYLTGFASDEASRSTFFDATLKLDVERGTVERLRAPAGCYVGEPVFVPRPEGKAEDDGYLLVMEHDANQGTAALAILDARDLAAGPLARARFDQMVPPGFHGAWVPSA